MIGSKGGSCQYRKKSSLSFRKCANICAGNLEKRREGRGKKIEGEGAPL